MSYVTVKYNYNAFYYLLDMLLTGRKIKILLLIFF